MNKLKCKMIIEWVIRGKAHLLEELLKGINEANIEIEEKEFLLLTSKVRKYNKISDIPEQDIDTIACMNNMLLSTDDKLYILFRLRKIV